MPEESPARGFDVVVSSRDDGPGAGPAWHQPIVEASLRRIDDTTTAEDARVQAAVEQLVVLHSIRRILIWTSVIIPAAVLVLAVILLVVTPA